MPSPVKALLEYLDLEMLEDNLFRGRSPQVGRKRVFGGQVIGQALVAAERTVEGRVPHSLHAYFMLPGDPARPIVYNVDRIRDGRSFTTRRVVAIQHGEAIFSMSASFQIEEPGLEHQLDAPAVPDPDTLPEETELRRRFMDAVPEAMRRFWQQPRPVEFRPVDYESYLSPHPAPRRDQYFWFRACERLPDDPAVHRCVLAYASDMTLLDTAVRAHGRTVFDPAVIAASLDHALWFHRPFRADEWLLYAEESPNAAGARGFARGSIFDRSGLLVASVAQEGLMRLRSRES